MSSSRHFLVKVNETALSSRLAGYDGSTGAIDLTRHWLRRAGFTPVGRVWQADAIALAKLKADEVELTCSYPLGRRVG